MSDQTVETRGARIAYVERGGGAPTFLFLHYWGGSSRTWAGVIEQLGADMRCIALDQRGWGRSEALDGRYDLDAMADDVEDVVGALGLDDVVLVGHSMGGKVAQIVASRSGWTPAALLLVAPAPHHPMPTPAEQRAAMLESYQSREGVMQAIKTLAGRRLTDTEREQVIADTLAGAPGAKREWTERGMIATVNDSVRNYAGPVHAIVGEHDQVEKPDSVKSATIEVFPTATVTIVPDAGHLLPIEAPGAIATAGREVAATLG